MAMSKQMRRTVAAVRAKYCLFQTDEAAEALVRLVLRVWRARESRKRPGHDDDARDIQNWSSFLHPLSKVELQTLVNSRAIHVRQQAKREAYPFDTLAEKARGFFATCPGGLIQRIARYRLQELEER